MSATNIISKISKIIEILQSKNEEDTSDVETLYEFDTSNDFIQIHYKDELGIEHIGFMPKHMTLIKNASVLSPSP